MSNASGIISSPVNQKTDVQYVLTGSTSGSVALSALCTHANINIWSKYKPVRWSGTTRTSTWWKGYHSNCGLEPFFVNDAVDLPQYIDGGRNGWTYYAPTGGTYPYRLLDFNGYNHNAQAPVRGFRIGPTTVSNRSGSTFGAWIMAVIASDNELNFSDINDMQNGFFAIACFRSGSNYPTVVVNDVRMGTEGETAIEVDCGGWTTGTYTIYPMMANSRDGDWFYTIPNTTYSTLTVQSNAQIIAITVVSKTIQNRTTARIGVLIQNNGSSSVTLTNNSWRTRPYTEGEDNPLTSDDNSGSLSDVTVAANSSESIQFTATMTRTAYEAGCILYVWFNSGAYRGDAQLTNIGGGDNPEI